MSQIKHIEVDGMKKSRNDILIVYPDSYNAILNQNMALCELFIEKILKSKEKIINIDFNTEKGFIKSNDKDIEHTLLLIQKTGKMNSFCEQIDRLLHTAPPKKEKSFLRIIQENDEINIIFYRYNFHPNFSWKIVK
jgi:hypothetical protein